MLRPTPPRSAVRLPPASPALLPVGAGEYSSSAEGKNIRAIGSEARTEEGRIISGDQTRRQTHYATFE